MARFARALSFLFIIFIAGCVPSRTQYSNIVQAINNRPVLTGYSKDYIVNRFGPPTEVIAQPLSKGHARMWVYKTNFKKDYAIVNIRPGKTRYMKLTFVGDTVLDSSYE